MDKHTKITPESIAGGVGTSEAISQSVRWITGDLDSIETRLNEIDGDSETSADKKFEFLSKYIEKISHTGDHHVHNMTLEIKDMQKALETEPPEPLQAHEAQLLADSLRRADDGKRLSVAGSDPRYLQLLESMPSAVFGMTATEHATLIQSVRRFNLGGEGLQATSQIAIDRDCLESIKKRRATLANKARQMAEQIKPSPDTSARQSRLYSFDD